MVLNRYLKNFRFVRLLVFKLWPFKETNLGVFPYVGSLGFVGFFSILDTDLERAMYEPKYIVIKWDLI